ncbi:hypothetical protein [Neptunomonas japonica]|uniref:Chemotaxis protein n=1 Tax=Neptunomonas japonica JAMM 1380 TaxID=1441457 RepID=A0A7R6PK26_9GAMM|nr:hypothetical protein [Neptunomonas japonica]BBB31043.1 conserved hypothetical protein [Neptunomonas japonica JAMM 1380]
MNKDIGIIILVISFLALIVAESMTTSSVRWAAEMGLFFGILLVGLPGIRGNKSPSGAAQQPPSVLEKEVLAPIFDQIEQIITHEALIIKQEVARTDGIIKEAVQVLGDSFKAVNLLSSQHRELSIELFNKANNPSIAATNYRYVSEHAQVIDALGEQLEGALSDAVSSLQFEDLSSQALTALNQNTHLLTQVAEQLKLISFHDATQIQTQLDNLLHSCRAIKLQQSIAVKRPVTQVGMQAGDVEIF